MIARMNNEHEDSSAPTTDVVDLPSYLSIYLGIIPDTATRDSPPPFKSFEHFEGVVRSSCRRVTEKLIESYRINPRGMFVDV